MSDADRLPPRLLWVLVGLTFAWGFNWSAMKVALHDITPWVFRALCLGLGSSVLFLVLRASGQKVTVPQGQWPRLALLAFFNITCWNLMVAYGLTMIASGRAAILAYTMPVLAVPLSVWLLGERMTSRKIAGLVLGLGGLALLLGEAVAGLGASPLGSLLALGAAFTWALGVVLQKRYPVAMPTLPYTAWIMLLGGVPVILGSFVFEDWRVLGDAGKWAWLGVAYNVFIAFAWAHWAWIKIATSVSVTVFSLSMLVIPVVGVLSGMLFLGERPSAAECGAALLIVASLATVVLPARGAPAPARDSTT
jgi:drug/metabolite transporter (DMT)-like permease